MRCYFDGALTQLDDSTYAYINAATILINKSVLLDVSFIASSNND